MDPADLAPQSPPRERDSPGVAPSMFGATEGAEEPVRLDETAGVEEAAPSAEDRLQAAGIVGSAKAAGTGEGGNVVDDSEAREDGEYARELEGGGEEYESHREGDSVPGGVLSKRRQRSESEEEDEAEAEDSNAVDANDLGYSAEDAKARRRAELDARIAAAVKAGKKRPRRKKGDEIDLDKENDEEIQELLKSMERAADDDFDANKERRLATAKLRMLPSVVEVMQKQSLQQSMMDNNFLSGVRRWLEPLGDRSLPSLTIQNALFPLLEKLEIDTMTLKQSGLGKIVLFYTKCGRVSLDIKRIANKLIESWTRPILKRDASERAQKAAMAERAKKMREAEKERRRELGEMVDDDEEVEELAAAAAAAGGGGEHGKDAAQIKLNRFKRRLREGKK